MLAARLDDSIITFESIFTKCIKIYLTVLDKLIYVHVNICTYIHNILIRYIIQRYSGVASWCNG